MEPGKGFTFPKCETMKQAEQIASKALRSHTQCAPWEANALPVFAAVLHGIGKGITAWELWRIEEEEVREIVNKTEGFSGAPDWYADKHSIPAMRLAIFECHRLGRL